MKFAVKIDVMQSFVNYKPVVTEVLGFDGSSFDNEEIQAKTAVGSVINCYPLNINLPVIQPVFPAKGQKKKSNEIKVRLSAITVGI